MTFWEEIRGFWNDYRLDIVIALIFSLAMGVLTFFLILALQGRL